MKRGNCRRTQGSALAALLCLGSGAEAAAAPPVAGKVSLEYRLGAGTAGCPDEAQFRERAADAYDFNDPFVPAGAAAAIGIRVEIAPAGTGYQGTITVLDPGGNAPTPATETDVSCNALVWTLAHRMALVIVKAPAAPAAVTPVAAVAGVPGVAGGAGVPGVAGGAGVPGVPAGPPCQACRDEKLDRRLDSMEETIESQALTIGSLQKQLAFQGKRLSELERKGPMDFTFALATGALLTANVTSNPGLGLWVAGDARSGPLVLGLEIRSVLPSPVVFGPFDLDYSHTVALFTPCGRYSYFFGCGVVGAGVQVYHDSNFLPSGGKTIVHPLLQFGGRIGVEVPFGDTMFGARAWGEVLFNTPTSTTTYGETGYRTVQPEVSGFFGLGLVMTFGKKET